MLRICKVVLGISLSMVLSFTAGASTIPALPAGDGVFYDEPGSSYDFFSSTDGSIAGHYQFFGTSDTFARRTGYVQFSLASLALADVGTATLNINLESVYLTGSTPSCGTIMHLANSAPANGNSSQRLGGTELVATMMPNMLTGWQSFDITDMLKNDLTAGYSWAVFSFHANETGDYAGRYAGFSFSSSEGGNAPYIEVTAVPEPAAMATMAVVCMGLLRRRRSV